MRRTIPLLPLAVMLAACQDGTTPTAPHTPFISANLVAAPKDYVVVLKSGVSDVDGTARRLASLERGTLKTTWQHAIKGFVVELTPATAADLASDANVASIEADGRMYATGVQSPVGSWGQDRLDQRALPLNNSFTYPTSGAGVHAYIIDTGINTTHTEFTGRIGLSRDFTNGLSGGGTNFIDCAGHGSHTSGTVGGTTYGLAKAVTLHAVRVLDCGGSGSWSWYISAINWIIANKQLPAVANASLGGSTFAAADLASRNLVAAGITFSVASGNSNADACNFTPGGQGKTNGLISVNASDIGDHRASFSNFGPCTDIYGPGVSIKSAWIGSATATQTISGTSMATPHSTGTAALYLGAHPTWTPAQVEAAMKADATVNAISGNGATTANLLLYVGNIGGGGGGNQPPVADFTVSCDATTHICTLDGGASTDDGGLSNLTFTWTAPNRPTKTGQVITRIAERAGITSVETLTVRDSGGLTSSVTKTIVFP